MLHKHVVNWSLCSSFQGQGNLPNHSNQQQQALNQKQIYVSLVQTPTQNSNKGTITVQRGPIDTMQRILNLWYYPTVQQFTLTIRQSKGLQKSHQKQPRYRIGSSLMGQNFSCRNVQQHDYKQKHNLKLSYINKQLQQLEIFQTNQTQQTGLVQKNQYQVEYGIYRIFGTNHQISTDPTSACQKHKQDIHRPPC